MLLIRPIENDDLDDLKALADQLDSMNLPGDRDFLAQRIEGSLRVTATRVIRRERVDDPQEPRLAHDPIGALAVVSGQPLDRPTVVGREPLERFHFAQCIVASTHLLVHQCESEAVLHSEGMRLHDFLEQSGGRAEIAAHPLDPRQPARYGRRVRIAGSHRRQELGRALQDAGYKLNGWEGAMAGDVPIAAGLSSSAALP